LQESIYSEAVEFLRARLPATPEVVLVLGSGLGGVVEDFASPVRISYQEIPGFPVSTVVGHSGAVVAGRWAGVEVVAMQGRLHLYEGGSPERVAFPLRVLSGLGVRIAVLTNAAGGIRPGWRPGDLMLIADHLNFMFTNPLMGPVRPGEQRFPDMSEPYDARLRGVALRTARGLGIPLSPGVYAGVLGPSFETPAEIRMLSRFGADAVGMSTVPEVLVARALGMPVLGISCVTNLAAGLGGRKLTHDEVLEVGGAAAASLIALLRAVLPRIAGPAGEGRT